MAQKIEIPTDLTQAYVPPADATIAQLDELAKEAQTSALARLADDSYTDEDLAVANWLSAAMDTIGGTKSGLEAAEADRNKARDDLRSKFTPAADPADENPDGGAAPVVTPAADAIPEPVVAAAVIPSVADIAKNSVRPQIRSGGAVALLAAADVPGFNAGSEVPIDRVGELWAARTRSRGAGSNTHPVNIATINITPADAGLVASSRAGISDLDEALAHATDESRLATSKGNGSLVAAGGWCAPSETLYDLLNLSTADGLLSVPEITASRGGLRWTTGPDFSAVYGSGGMFTLTEAQAIAGNVKPVFDIPCPPFTEKRMDADGAFYTGDILSQHGYPEAISDFLTKAQIAWQHYISHKSIADIVLGSTAVDLSQFGTPTPAAPEYGALSTVLGALELQIIDMKYRGRLAEGQALEVVFPLFARGVFRADIAKRQGGDALANLALTDAQINEMFTVRGANVQYVYDWQDAIADAVALGFGAETTEILSWPQTFKGIVYPSGTWARALSPVIELNATYDSTLLKNNQYVALFMEQGRLTIKRGFDSRIITFASNPNGVTGGVVAPPVTAQV